MTSFDVEGEAVAVAVVVVVVVVVVVAAAAAVAAVVAAVEQLYGQRLKMEVVQEAQYPT